jgi:hypothetical protein
MPEDLSPEIHDKVGGLRHLMLKGDSRFVAQIQTCDEEDDQDTRDDLRSILENPPAEFAAALAKDVMRFLLVTYDPAEREWLRKVIDTFVRKGLVQFECADDVRILTV